MLQRYSRQQAVAKRLSKTTSYARSVTTDVDSHAWESQPRIHKLDQRLSLETVEALFADYLAGMSSRAVAEKYGIQKNSVLGLLKRHGVARPRTVVTDEQADQAVQLLQSGIALKPAAELLELAPTTLARALQSRGLPTRKVWA